MLLAILDEVEPQAARAAVEGSLATVLAAARMRRRTRTLRRSIGLAALVMMAVASWRGLVQTDGRREPERADMVSSCTIVRTRPLEPEAIVLTRSDTVCVASTRTADVVSISTHDLPGTVEVVADEETFLANLPGAGGFIGSGQDRSFIWLGAASEKSPGRP